MPKIHKLPKIRKSSMLGGGGAWSREREREGWWVSGNWLKVKNKAKNLGDLVILTYLGQIFYNWVK